MNSLRSLSDRDRRTVRFASIGIAIYLVLFGGFEVWKYFDQRRADYRALAQEARDLRQQTLPYQEKVLVVKKLMDDFHLDPARLKHANVVSEASAAIQRSARSGGVGLGPIRETQARGSSGTLATIQLDGSGPVTAVLSFLAGLNIIGYPLVVDSVQFTPDNRPGQIKMNVTILILDFDQQKESKEAPHA
jgi:hypothetical protein